MRSILVPLDGSDFSEQALPVAIALARRAGASLRLIHVYQPLNGYPGEIPPLEDSGDIDTRDYLWHYLESFAQKSRDAGVETRRDLLSGGAVAGITAALHSGGEDLIVMTTHGRGGLARTWLGSTADGLVRQARVPVLLLRPAGEGVDPQAEPIWRRVLVPLDGSTLSERIMPPAVDLAKLLGARVTLTTVVHPAETAGAAQARESAERKQLRIDPAHGYLEDIACQIRGQVAIDTHVHEHGSAAPGILAAAAEVGADLIAMATHGRSGLTRLLLGSVADKVLRATTLPILLHRPD